MEIKPIQSKLIEGLSYDPESRQLALYFTDGHRATFAEVPEGVVLGLEIANSPGSYYMTQIRDVYARV
ncbi:KTSC domain-containing protein [Rhizobium sp. RAF56]|uniref:KTSC domain-containing protein n=1 Tax=Rhizobium sp. RAF56 TaxID=3233062 RepID=UPI003F9A764B